MGIDVTGRRAGARYTGCSRQPQQSKDMSSGIDFKRAALAACSRAAFTDLVPSRKSAAFHGKPGKWKWRQLAGRYAVISEAAIFAEGSTRENDPYLVRQE